MFKVVWKTQNNEILSKEFSDLIDALSQYNKLYKTAGVIFGEVYQDDILFLSFRK